MGWPRTQSVVGVEFTNAVMRISARNPKNGNVIEGEYGRPRGDQNTSDTDITWGLEQVKHLSAFVQANRLQGCPVVMSVPNDMVVVRYMQLPNLPEKALKQTVEVELGASIHLPFEHPIYELKSVDCINQRELREGFRTVCLIASAKDEVDRMTNVVTAAGLRPLAVDVSPFAILRSFQIEPENSEGLTCLVQIDSNTIAMSIFIKSNLYFFRTVEFSTDSLRDGDVSVLANDVGYELERVINFFNFNLSDGEREVDRCLVHSTMGNAVIFSNSLSSRLGHSITYLDALGYELSDNKYALALGLALKGRGA